MARQAEILLLEPDCWLGKVISDLQSRVTALEAEVAALRAAATTATPATPAAAEETTKVVAIEQTTTTTDEAAPTETPVAEAEGDEIVL